MEKWGHLVCGAQSALPVKMAVWATKDYQDFQDKLVKRATKVNMEILGHQE